MKQAQILIVEDNKINAVVLLKTLEKYYSCVHAVSDQETFRALKTHTFQLILMDINLGGNSLDGESIMKQLKQDETFQHIPIFAITSYAMKGDRERFLAAGFDNYFSKPIDRKALLAGIEGILPRPTTS